MFIGRERELNELERLYQSEAFEFVVLYGRRRVGKTALLNRFLERKPAVYFMGVESNAKQNLENFSKSILEYASGDAMEGSFRSFQDALEYLFKRSERERFILAIDEYPYAARASKSLASTLQLLIDQYKDRSRLLLILCGSSMSYMEDHVLSYKAPLFGRRTAQLRLLPFDFEETCRYLKGFSDTEKALAYGMVGGTPQYLQQLDESLGMEENIKRLFLNPVSSLYEEPVNLLKQEVREPAVYTAIITAIAGGASKMSEISGKIGEDTNVCTVYLKNLIALGIIRKETPYGTKNARKSLYQIEDNLFRFWYRFVPENVSLISRGARERVYQRIVPFFPDYMGKVFEEICAQYLWKLLLDGSSPVEFTSLGRWWGNDPVRKSQVEIDLMGEEDSRTGLFAECKWTNEKVDLGVLNALTERSRLFPYEKRYFILFSKSGFTKGCAEAVQKRGDITLISFREMMRAWNAGFSKKH